MMKVFNANISRQIADNLGKKLNRISLYRSANEKLFLSFGINNFFGDQLEFDYFKNTISYSDSIVSEPDRTEYGDFQTNLDFARAITSFLKNKKKINPRLLIEPTCGKGNFIIAALSNFEKIEKIVGVEIYKPYIWETKFNIIDFYIANPTKNKPVIEIHHFNVFEFDFRSLLKEFRSEILVLGNPPWVTNSKLSCLESNNLPEKSNFKKFNGIDAITGKGNFDIGEYITLMMLNAFQNTFGNVALLVKNSVIKNVLFDQYQQIFKISDIEKLTINSKKEFNVSVDASLLFCKLNSSPEFTCKEYDFYNSDKLVREFGWVYHKFVSNSDFYIHSKDIDGFSKFEWRQGIKHDLSQIMELERDNNYYFNGNGEKINLEEGLIYGVLKSSDLKYKVIYEPRKFTIITQTKVGQDTSYIKLKYPQIFNYLQKHKQYFERRKSSIYKGKPNFSIFGIGDYSFSKYKVAISGLYKTSSFSLILPFDEKPLMLDDTCYFLGFDNIEFAAYTTILLNSAKAREFLLSITFNDAKRTFTKEILMRIDLFKLTKHISKRAIQKDLDSFCENYKLSVSLDKWDNYLQILDPSKSVKQMDIFTLTKDKT